MKNSTFMPLFWTLCPHEKIEGENRKSIKLQGKICVIFTGHFSDFTFVTRSILTINP